MIPLPVKVYDKCSYIIFNIEINKNILTIVPYQSPTNKTQVNMLQHIVLCNEEYGVNIIPIIFPLTFMIIKEELVCDMFYLFKLLSGNNMNDFIYNMITTINMKFERNFVLYTDMNIANLISVLQLQNNENNEEVLENTINKMFYRINRYINFCIVIMSQPIINISQGSKINIIINIIKSNRITFLGNNMTVEEHIEHILNPSLLKKKRYYFYENNNKILKIQYNEKYKENLVAYPSKYKHLITINNMLDDLIIYNYRLLFNITAKVLFKKKLDMVKMLEDYIYENNVDSLYEIIKNDMSVYIKISYNKFTNIIEDDYNEKIFNYLLTNYTYPVNYDKRELSDTFAKILYYSIKFNTSINFITINSKIKQILISIIKFYNSLKSQTQDCIYQSKYYTDNMIFNIVKILLLNDTYNLLENINNINNIRTKFLNNLVLIQLLNNISWKTLHKQLDYFKYIVNIKDAYTNLIIGDDKIHKLCVNMDNRLKKVIIEPLYMFVYLKNENDFYKWICEFKDMIYTIFNNNIILDDNDLIILSKILFIYSKIKTQSMEDKYYKKFIHTVKNNTKLILFNDRINIKFKELFKHININLGYLARDILNEETITITESSEIDDVTATINKLKQKYYKYKGKYMEITRKI